MRKKKNYLENIPLKHCNISTVKEEDGQITLLKPNTGIFDRFAQRFFKRPPVTHIALDQFGTFVWEDIDGEKDLTQIGKDVSERFGEEAEPLYERLSKYFYILEEEKLIIFKKKV